MLLLYLKCPRLDLNVLVYGDENFETEVPTALELVVPTCSRDVELIDALLSCANIRFRKTSKIVMKHASVLVAGLLRNGKLPEAENLCQLALTNAADTKFSVRGYNKLKKVCLQFFNEDVMAHLVCEVA